MNKGSNPRPPANRVVNFDAPASDDLGFTVELWNLTKVERERIIARSGSLEVAKAAYATAALEHPFRRIVLRHGLRIICATN